jgi:hypothetical protein
MTVRKERELEQALETAQADERKNECSGEQLNDFSQQAERAVALRLTTEKETEEGNEHSEEWLITFSRGVERKEVVAWEMTAEDKEESEHSEEWLDIFNIVAEETTTGEFAAEGEENENFEECLNDFIQEDERAAALKLTAEEAEKEEEHSEEWLSIFNHEVENNATEEVAETENEDTDNICLAELWEQIEALEDRVKVQGMHIQQVRLETDEEGVGDHDDLPNGPKFLQLWRLQQKNQPLEGEVMQEHLSNAASQPHQRTCIHVMKRRRSLIHVCIECN